MSGNAGFLFYHEFYDKYKDDDWREIITKKKSSEINLNAATKRHIKNTNDNILKLENNINSSKFFQSSQSFKLTTTYPGLVLGTGYHHETGVEGEFKIGFYFDYTTGLPVIPGSSVKGALRSVFPNSGNKKLTAEYKDPRTAYIRETLKKIGIDSAESIDIDKLELEIFKGIKNNKAKKPGDKYLPLYKRDIFHDAFPVSVETDGLFSDDFITPHKNPLKNPIPLKFLKVSPGVSFQFNFDLKDSETCQITAEEKLKLFVHILFDMGVGAKTNVGYGQFDDTVKTKLLEDIDKKYAKRKEQELLSSMTVSEQKEARKKKFIDRIKSLQDSPKELFDKWQEMELPGDEKDVAHALIEFFNKRKLMPSKPQLRYLADKMGIDRTELKEKFI